MKMGHDLRLETWYEKKSGHHRNITDISHPVSLACLTRSPQIFKNSVIPATAVCGTGTPIILIGHLVKHLDPKILDDLGTFGCPWK